MVIVRDALELNTITEEHVQSLSNLRADLRVEFQQESECVTSR